MERENDLVARCREMIEKSLNWGNSENWTNQDFENLSEKIFEKTQVRLSVSTLKRIWGKVRYDSSPTPATLNVLARFVGLENWRSFQQSQEPSVSPRATEPAEPVKPISQPKKSYRWVAVMGVIIIGAISIYALVKGKAPVTEKSESKGTADTVNVLFTARKVTDDLPNSVVFTYDASGFNADSVFIQQSWDPRRRQKVSPTGREHTSIYYRPGYFLAKLVINDRIKAEDVVFIKTQGWRGMIDMGGPDNTPPVYLSKKEMSAVGLGIAGSTLRNKIGSPVFNERGVSFHNVREFDSLMGDAFRFDVSLRNTSTIEECICRMVEITLLTKDGAIIVPLSAKGCISKIGVLSPDGWIGGDTNDLSAFGCDFKKFEHVTVEVKNKNFEVSLNDKSILQRALPNGSVGEIVGIRITFEGTGQIEHVKLSSPDKVVYEERFIVNSFAP
jgi:hypothetical protein